MKRVHASKRAGSTLIMFTLALIPLLGITGLVVDIGWAYFRREMAQTAADAAANAAASAAFVAGGSAAPLCTTPTVGCYATAYSCPATIITPPVNNILAGCLYARDNGFVNSGNQTVTFTAGVGNAPSSSGVTVGYWVQARVTENIPQLFSAVLGFPTATVLGVTTTGDQTGSAGGCVIALNPNGSGAISMTGTASLQSGCGVYVDSTSGSAISMSGGATITTTGSARTQIVGNWSGSGGSTISPAPLTGVSPIVNPFAGITAPTVGGCTDGGSGVSLSGHNTQTISPGVLCGGISLSGQSALTLNPGLYVIKNGLSMSGGTTITGAGVTLYILTGSVSLSGGATVSMTAPSSGTWQGVLMFQDASDTSSASLTGGSSQLMNGLLYFPGATLSFTGGSSLSGVAASLVARNISLVGNSYISSAAVTQYTGSNGRVVMIQ